MTEPVNSLLRLLIAHFAVTFFFSWQTADGQTASSPWRSPRLYIGAIVYALVMYTVTFDFQAILLIPLFFLIFLLINGLLGLTSSRFQTLLLAQLLFLLFIFFLWTALQIPSVLEIMPFITGTVIPFFRNNILESRNTLLVTLGYIVVLWPFGPLIGLVTRPLRRQFDTEDKLGLAQAGLWIGCLERFLIYSFILTDYMLAIGFLVAVKSVFRFGEIKDAAHRKEAEYMLIGSLLSFGVAILTGFVVKSLLVN